VRTISLSRCKSYSVCVHGDVLTGLVAFFVLGQIRIRVNVIIHFRVVVGMYILLSQLGGPHFFMSFRS
jgi:hypothetical protein